MKSAPIDTHHKALSLNLDTKIYGTIAEIGAGQEVSRWFFHVGGAAGTIAKTISAYDMVVSDELYGKGTRYVSRDRVQSMIAHEFEALLAHVAPSRDKDTRFFAFADSVSARNYAGTNECHGWLGIRCQMSPGSDPTDILLHVNMNDPTNQLQQEALGVLGVNLIYGAFQYCSSIKEFVLGLMDGITPGRLEIDTIYCSGPVFGELLPLELGALLIEHSLAPAVMFDKKANLCPPTEVFYKRPLVLVRAAFDRRMSELHSDLLRAGLAQLGRERTPDCKEPLAFLELSIGGSSTEIESSAKITDRVAEALRYGDRLLLTRFRENYLLTTYLRRYAAKTPIRFALGSSTLVLLFHDRYYADVPGQVLEGLGRLFAQNVRAFVLPMKKEAFESHVAAAIGIRPSDQTGPDGMVSLSTLKFEPPFDHLFRYLCSIEALEPLQPV